MGWMYLLIAGVFEVGYAICLKLSNGFANLPYTVAFIASASVSFGLLNLACRTIPLSTAYAIWTGIGASGTAVVGILMFSEPAHLGRLVFLGLIVAAIVGLKLVSPPEKT
jgi:quaternary ammonium compound-resistance protein SugE